ncbi:MAG: VOC family protein [Acidimicrobiia bacterium]|nr:VOC family protein [Acidimicrobiia bacterium]
MITGLAGVIVYTTVERFPAMRSFYVDVLGLEPRSDRESFVNFELGEQRLTVTVHSELAGEATDPLRVMINLACDDIRTDHEAAVARGARSLRPPEQESWGGIVATLTDPDGNIVQLLQMAAPT